MQIVKKIDVKYCKISNTKSVVNLSELCDENQTLGRKLNMRFN